MLFSNIHLSSLLLQTMFKFLMFVCGLLSDVFFVTILGTTLYWLLFFKVSTFQYYSVIKTVTVISTFIQALIATRAKMCAKTEVHSSPGPEVSPTVHTQKHIQQQQVRGKEFQKQTQQKGGQRQSGKEIRC